MPAIRPPPPTGTKMASIFIAMALAQDLHGYRALAGDDIRIIERVHEHQISLAAEFRGLLVGMIVVIAVQYDFAAQISDSLHLDFRRGERHHDDRRNSARARGQCDALRVVACRGADDAALRADRRQLRDLVVGAANFERKHRLQVFTFEPDVIVQTARQPRCGLQRGLDGDIVDFGFENAIDVVFLHGRHCWSCYISSSGRPAVCPARDCETFHSPRSLGALNGALIR